FSEAADAVVLLDGGVHEFVQCTIANNYLFSAISQPLLTLLNAVPDEEGAVAPAAPLMSANFENSIIYGLAADISPGDLSGSNVYLRNVLLKSAGNNDDHFIDCLWDTDPLFLTNREEYYFNYMPASDSPAVDAGNPAFVRPFFQYDMFGTDRLRPGSYGVTLGALVPLPE
ncbi:MAG: hypothetical protein K2M03_05625, partial [Muribaculaceae bacterium]|nr:hypothetical protein [Muribaculaceae bacterium]